MNASTFNLFLSSVSNEVAGLRDIVDSYGLLESLLTPGTERPSLSAVGAMLRVLNHELSQRMSRVEELLARS